MSNSTPTCPICGEGNLHAQTRQQVVERNSRKLNVTLSFSVCDTCQCEQASPDQLKQNKRAMIAARKMADGLLSGNEVRKLRDKLGLKQAQAAKVFGGGPVAFSKYESDDTAQSEAMDNLLRVAEAEPSAFSFLLNRSGVEAGSIIKKASWSKIGTWESQPARNQVIGRHVATYDLTAYPAANQNEYKAA